jgi:hypothetical protein
MRLEPEALLTAGEASTYDAMIAAVAGGAVLPLALGDFSLDLVYTPVKPCRIVDTRLAGGVIVVGTPRTFDVDGSSFTGQGGVNASCGIPFGVARAVAMTITATGAAANGRFLAYELGPQPAPATTLYFARGQNISNTTIVSVSPGTGSDFNLAASVASANAIIDVVGYFAAPVATPLDCITVSSAVTAVPVNAWTAVNASCPAGRTATGGGYDTTEGTLGYPGVWITSLPNGNGWRTWVDNQTNGARSIQTFARCCRVPGR